MSAVSLAEEHKPSVEPAWPLPIEPPVRIRPVRLRFIPALELWGGRFQQLLSRTRLDSAALHGPGGAPKATPLGAHASLVFARRIERVSWPSNVVAMLRGSDPDLCDENVVVTAHLDGLGEAKNVRPGPEAVLNGADDNASGVAGLIEIARSMSSPGSRPRRSVIFAAVSGEKRGLWGSDYFASRSPVRSANVVANVNLDMVGRAKSDSAHEDYQLTTHDAGKVNYGALTRIARAVHDLTLGIAKTPGPMHRKLSARALP